MTTSTVPIKAGPTGPSLRQRLGRATPYLLLAPGILWLVIFFILPSIQMFLTSVSTGSLDNGFKLTWSGAAYVTALTKFGPQFVNSILYAGMATILTFLVGFPVAYTIAFRGGRYKNFLLFIVIAPFFTSFLIRTISWKVLFLDDGPVLNFMRNGLHILPADASVIGTPIAVIAGITYNFLPFMILPLYVALEKIDPRLVEAANDLYASRWGAFRRVTIPLALPGIFAGTLLVLIPALGDYVNAALLGGPQTVMIGNVIQSRFLLLGDYPVAAALSFLLMAAILVGVSIYARALGTEQLTG
jgi:spermidine/putrescine transport system permease protein